MKQATCTALRLTGSEASIEWLTRSWDTYGFDFDLNRIGLIWPLSENDMKTLKQELRKDGITFEVTKVTF